MSRRTHGAMSERLKARALRVRELLSEGMSQVDVAERLGLTPRQVRWAAMTDKHREERNAASRQRIAEGREE